ncbi:MAG: hypothetical protein IT379_18490 [Deltaproteobacteria bacterium]|nr:hypothetical protein [Deltaproteobacteria bacterium]
MVVAAVAFALSAGAVWGIAAAVDVRGAFQAAPGAAPTLITPRRPAFYWEEWNGFLAPRARTIDPPRDLAFALVGPPPAQQAEARVTVELVDGSLRPASIVVRPGTTVRFENRDELAHELYGVDYPAIGPEATSPNAARVVTLSDVRIIEIRDRRVPHLRGYIAVTPVAYAGNPAADGTMTITGVAAGSYTLKVLFDGRWVHEQPVEVVEGREATIPPIRIEPPPGAAPAPSTTASAPTPPAAPAPTPPAGGR